ncbi:hypothetical protein [Paenibacillus alvei]|uniref:hypothetical protein n=1 Tax=Paenibacillus alvei TaxID=44250 RepID=UPI00227DD168|nr:hypothetical protein [Paenibacillus alvei]MCY7487492.1 hypothetical protein [Paenibacillus alvei]
MTREQWIDHHQRTLRQMMLINESTNGDELNTFTDREQIAEYVRRGAAALVKLKLIEGANQQVEENNEPCRSSLVLIESFLWYCKSNQIR